MTPRPAIILSALMLTSVHSLCDCSEAVSKPRAESTSRVTHRVLSDRERALPPAIQRLLIAYPEQLVTARQAPDAPPLNDLTRLDERRVGELVWRVGPPSAWRASGREVSLHAWSSASSETRRRWFGGRDFMEVLNQPDLGDQMLQQYPKGEPLPTALPINFEPGRIRNEPFFKRLYGSSRREVGANLVRIRWGAKLIRVTRVNRIDEKLKQIYRELSALERRFRRYYRESAGAFVWRKIKGTSRISVHSFGAAIDIGVRYSNYWRWTLSARRLKPDAQIPYLNRFPLEVIKIFERHGWVWGGWWYHHDTMHFEYRPELLVSLDQRERSEVISR